MRNREKRVRFWSQSEGKGTFGCLFSIILLGAGALIGMKVVPIYYSFSNLETEVKTETSRAGAHFYDDQRIIRSVLELAKKDEIRLESKDIKVVRMAGQVFVDIHTEVPIDFVFFEYSLTFNIKASSYIGAL
jgi:hypothetical protein